MKRKLSVSKVGNKAVIELSPIDPNEDTVDILREIRDRIVEQVGLTEKGKVHLGKILSQEVGG